MAKSILWPLAFALLGACSAPVSNNSQAATEAEVPAGPAKPFVALSAAEITKRLPGHYIDESPYDCFHGPLLINADGSFEAMPDWGATQGKYAITDGQIEFDDQGAPEHFDVTIELFRDQHDQLYFRYAGDANDPALAVLKPADPHVYDTLCHTGAPSNAN